MSLTNDHSVVVQTLVDLLKTTHVPKELKRVYYGDQARIPDMPSATVTAGQKQRGFNQTGHQYEIEFETVILLYHGAVKDLQGITKDVDQLAQVIEATINADRKMVDDADAAQVVSSLCTSIEPGFAERGNALMVVHKITHNAISRHQVGT